MKYLKLFEEVNLSTIKWVHSNLLLELNQLLDLKSQNDMYNYLDNKVIPYKAMYVFDYSINGYKSKPGVKDGKKAVEQILNNWKQKLFRQYILLNYRFGSGSLEIVYKDLYVGRVKPRRFLYHTTGYLNRDSILENGLIPKAHSESEKWKSHTDLYYPPAIFATNDDSTWLDGDIWQIDTTKIDNKWFKDLNIQSRWRIMTFEPIPPSALKLLTHKNEVI